MGDCVRLASEIRNDNPSVKHIIDQFDEFSNDNADDVLAALNSTEVYDRWTSEEIIYFFCKYEERLAAENGEEIDRVTWGKIWEKASKDRSVEHIYPQKDPSGNWKGKGRQKVNPESFVHRLGNLLVLPPGINSKAGTMAFAEKVKVYKSVSGLHHVKGVIRLRDWNLAAIEKREKELLKFAKEQWWR